MTERERLIELLRKDVACDTADCEKCLTGKHCYQRLTADYLLENGVIVPPLKIGQTVYRVLAGEITAVEKIKMPDGEKTFYNMQVGSAGCFFEEKEIGKEILLTKEDAIKALEEWKNEYNKTS